MFALVIRNQLNILYIVIVVHENYMHNIKKTFYVNSAYLLHGN